MLNSDHPRCRTALFAMAAFICAIPAHAVSYNNQTLAGTVLLPALPFPQTHSFLNTIALDNATVELEGYLRNEQNPVIVQGNGLINIRGPEGIWTNGWTYSHLTIGSGVEVNAYSGARFYADGVNQGTIAATPGGNGGVYGNKFSIGLDDFTNEGLIEARASSTIEMYLMDGLFENDGTIRVHPTARLDLAIEEGFPIAPANLGTIENNGLVRLNQFRMTDHGVFELSGAGVWEFGRYTQVVNSTLTIPASATARIVSKSSPSTRLEGVTINGAIESIAHSEVTIENGLELNGQWRTATFSEIVFDGTQTVSGASQFITDGYTVFRIANGSTTFGSDTALVVPSNGSLFLTCDLITPPATSYIFQGDISVTGGTFTTSLGISENHGNIHAVDGGHIVFGGGLANHGMIRVDSGALLNLAGASINNGTIIVENANIRLGSVPQGNVISITDSTIHAAIPNQTLAHLQDIVRTRSEVVAATTVNLAGQTLTIADQDNHRWALGAGGYQNGAINSADGFELLTRGSGGVLRHLELNANARITAGNTLQISADVTGTGDLIVDGGTLKFGGYGNTGQPMTSDAVARVKLQPGAAGSRVTITGPLNNAGRSIYLKSGAVWTLSVLRTKGITGGRIEGDPGVELLVYGYAGAPPVYGDLNGVTLATNAKLGSAVLSIVGGLTLDSGVLTIGNSSWAENTSAIATFHGDSAIIGSGEIRFDGLPPLQTNTHPFAIKTSAPSARLTIASGVTVRTSGGNGAFFYGNKLPGTLTNEGLLLAENGHTLTLITDDFVQRGTLRATFGSTLAVIDSSLTNEGRLEIASGQITFSGDLAQTMEASIDVELSTPMSAMLLPSIHATGAIALAGDLNVTLAPDYTPAPGDAFLLLAADAGFSGSFADVALPQLDSGNYWNFAFTTAPNALALTVQSGGPLGDFNSNGQTDGADFLAWQRGQSPNPLSAEDLAAWRNNYGATTATPALTAVPEPSRLILLIALLAPASLRRIPNRKNP